MEVGCGSLSAGRHLLKYLDEGRYWGFERDRELFDAGVQAELPRMGVAVERGYYLVNDTFDFTAIPVKFDLVITSSQVRLMTLNSVARMTASVLRQLAPAGRFVMTWPENPDPRSFEPIQWADGTITYPDREPFHYPFDVLARVFEAMGGRAVRVDDASHPRGESVMVITRNG
jgi:SAM-dependent methyltransferase